MNGDKARHTATFFVFAANGVARTFRGNHQDVDGGLRLDQAKMHVEAMRECDGRAVADVGCNVITCRCQPAARPGVAIIIRSAQAAASATFMTLKPSASAFRAVVDPSRKATATSVTAAVFQVHGMGTALAEP